MNFYPSPTIPNSSKEDTDSQFVAKKSTYTYKWLLDEACIYNIRKMGSKNKNILMETSEFSFDDECLKDTPNFIKIYLLLEDIRKIRVCLKVTLGDPKVPENFTHRDVILNHAFCRFCQYPSSTVELVETTLKEMRLAFRQNDISDGDEDDLYRYAILVPNDLQLKSYGLDFDIEFTSMHWCEAPQKKMFRAESREDGTYLGPLNLDSLFRTKYLADVWIFSSDGKFKIPAHRIVLADRSTIFATMFEPAKEPSVNGNIYMNNVPPRIIEEFIKYLYTGEADIENLAPELFRVADNYRVNSLKLRCENYLVATVTNNNVLARFQLAKSLNSERLFQHCAEITRERAKDVMKTPSNRPRKPRRR